MRHIQIVNYFSFANANGCGVFQKAKAMINKIIVESEVRENRKCQKLDRRLSHGRHLSVSSCSG